LIKVKVFFICAYSFEKTAFTDCFNYSKTRNPKRTNFSLFFFDVPCGSLEIKLYDSKPSIAIKCKEESRFILEEFAKATENACG